MIVRFHLRLSRRSCDSIQVLFHGLEDSTTRDLVAGFGKLLVHHVEATRCAGQRMSPGFRTQAGAGTSMQPGTWLSA